MSTNVRPRKTLSREQQIDLVVKLGRKNACIDRLREKVQRGLDMKAGGLQFDVSIIEEAVRQLESEAAPPAAPARPPSPVRTPAKRRRPNSDENRKPKADNTKPSGADSQAKSTPERKEKMKASPKGLRTPLSAKRRRSGAKKALEGLSIRELKARLHEQGLNCAGCVEKADLEALWDRFETWRERPLTELQDLCQASGGMRFDSVDECAKYLAEFKSKQQQPKASSPAQAAPPPAAASAPAAPAPAKAAEPAAAPADREQDAQREILRILPLRRDSFTTPTAWGFAVLGVPTATREVATVQRAYRTLMRKLHPDRIGQSEDLCKAVEKVREAKETCERGLSRQEPPSAPRSVRSETLCAVPGKRKFQLCWTAPVARECAPVRRYVVAAFDPAYGKALTVTVLEPDYSQELRSFVAIENLTSYVMAEEDLQKMPKLWTQSVLTVQVAAANEAGQSQWTTHKISLNAPVGAGNVTEPPQCFVLPTAKAAPPSFASAAAARKQQSAPDESEVASFNLELRKLRGSAKLRAFLEPTRKGIIQAWLRSVNWSASGSKQDLVERVIFIREAMVA